MSMAAIISDSHLCFIGNDGQFKSWLAEYDYKLYLDYAAEIKGSNGCKRIVAALSTLLPKLDQKSLLEFIIKTHPNSAHPSILNKISDLIKDVGSTPALTLPMRRVLRGLNNQNDIKRIQEENEICYSVTIGHITVIEWIPNKYKDLASKIPHEAWLHKALSLDNITGL